MRISRSSVGNDAIGCTWALGTERLIRYSEMEKYLHIYVSHVKHFFCIEGFGLEDWSLFILFYYFPHLFYFPNASFHAV